jgi:hypothetical protein
MENRKLTAVVKGALGSLHPSHYLALAIAALLIAGSFFLPNIIARITDSNRLDNLITIDSRYVNFDSAPELSLPARIALIASPNTETLPLKTGLALDQKSAGDKAIAELKRFFNGASFAFESDKQIVEECAAVFLLDAEDPSVNMIIWELSLSDPTGNELIISVDDETGMIIKIIFRWLNVDSLPAGSSNSNVFSVVPDSELYSIALDLTALMAAYYGFPVELADYQYSGSLAYYRADIPGDSDMISMYGVVRASSLTMNEKLLSIDN